MGSNPITWIVFGALAGWIASMVVRTNERQGVFGNIVIGIVGAILGGFIVQTLGGTGMNGFNLSSLMIAIFGSVILLAVVKSFLSIIKPKGSYFYNKKKGVGNA